MVSKNTAEGLRAVLAAVDMGAIAGNPNAMKAHTYLVKFVEYLEGPAYAALAEKRLHAANKSRKKSPGQAGGAQ